jgi:hypothetical protein
LSLYYPFNIYIYIEKNKPLGILLTLASRTVVNYDCLLTQSMHVCMQVSCLSSLFVFTVRVRYICGSLPFIALLFFSFLCLFVCLIFFYLFIFIIKQKKGFKVGSFSLLIQKEKKCGRFYKHKKNGLSNNKLKTKYKQRLRNGSNK